MATEITGNIVRINNDLVVTLAGDETCTIYTKGGQPLMIITMSSNQHQVNVQTVPITQLAANTDIGSTGWFAGYTPTEADREEDKGIDATITGGPRDDIRGGVRRRR